MRRKRHVRRGLSRAVIAENRDHIAFFDLEINALKDFGQMCLIFKVDILEADQRRINVVLPHPLAPAINIT
jgi:hypothetical protein